MIWSWNKFAHAMAALLPWYVQNYFTIKPLNHEQQKIRVLRIKFRKYQWNSSEINILPWWLLIKSAKDIKAHNHILFYRGVLSRWGTTRNLRHKAPPQDTRLQRDVWLVLIIQICFLFKEYWILENNNEVYCILRIRRCMYIYWINDFWFLSLF